MLTCSEYLLTDKVSTVLPYWFNR